MSENSKKTVTMDTNLDFEKDYGNPLFNLYVKLQKRYFEHLDILFDSLEFDVDDLFPQYLQSAGIMYWTEQGNTTFKDMIVEYPDAIDRLSNLTPNKISASNISVIAGFFAKANYSLAIFKVLLDEPKFLESQIESYICELLDCIACITFTVGGCTATEIYRKKIKEMPFNIHHKGAEKRAANFQAKKEKAKQRFTEGNYRTYTACAEEIYKDLDVSYNTVLGWLYELSKKP